MTEQRSKKTRRNLSAEMIVEHAIQRADQDGIDAVSMRQLANMLGVTAMSVYNHIENKDALIDLMLARVVARFETPAIHETWTDALRRRARSMYQTFLAHPWAPMLLMSQISLSEEILRDLNATLGCLVSSGLSYAEADWIRNTVDSFVYGYTIQELNYPVEPEVFKAAAAQFLPMIPQKKYPFMHQSALEIIEGRYDGRTNFDFGLDLTLEGLARWANKR